MAHDPSDSPRSSGPDAPREFSPIERLPTGVPGLDVVLGGGLLRGGTYILMGPPGTGKTILGNQICFHHVGTGGRAVYVTLLAESHGRMIAHLRSLRFFDPTPIAEQLTYVSGYRTLEREGIGGLLDLLRKQVREHRASLLVLDGLVSAEAFAESELAFKKFIHELHTLVSVIGCTTLLLTNGTTRTVSPEHTMVDGLVELRDEMRDLRAIRELSVRKFRGSAHLRGWHTFAITDTGIVVHARLESMVLRTPGAEPLELPSEPTGVSGLDTMLRQGGVAAGSTTVAFGPPGTGKTLLGAHFLAAARKKHQTALHFGFFESPPRLLAMADRFGLPLRAMHEEGKLLFQWQPPVELVADALAERLFKLIDAHKVERVVIDGLVGFRQALAFPERLGRFLAALTNELRVRGTTSYFTDESRVLSGRRQELPVDGMSTVVENLIELRHDEEEGELRQKIAIVKSRDGSHDCRIRRLSIGARGAAIEEVELAASGSTEPTSEPRDPVG